MYTQYAKIVKRRCTGTKKPQISLRLIKSGKRGSSPQLTLRPARAISTPPQPSSRREHGVARPSPYTKKGPGISGTLLSGKRGSNSRPRPWQGRALPTELFPRFGFATAKVRTFFNLPKFFEEIFKKFLSPPPNQLYHCLKFPEEPYIILKIVAQILNLPFEHCNSLHTHTECKA